MRLAATQVPFCKVKVAPQAVHLAVKSAHATQLAEHLVHWLLPGLYVVGGHA